MASIRFNEKRKRWVIRYYDHNGQRGWETMPKDSTKRDALRRRREIEEQIERKTFKRPTQIPTFKEVARQWQEAKSGVIRHSTLDQYKGHLSNYLVPHFGHMKCNEVDLTAVERFVSERTRAGMHPNTLLKIVVTLGAVMKYASHPCRGYAQYNPTVHIENRPRRVKREAEMATEVEIKAIAGQMENERDRLIVLTMAMGDCAWVRSSDCNGGTSSGRTRRSMCEGHSITGIFSSQKAQSQSARLTCPRICSMS